MWKWIGLATVLAACADGETDRTTIILGLTGDSVAGETLYTNNCVTCHDADGSGTDGPGNDIRDEDAESIVESVIVPPTSSMAAFADLLSDQEIADIAAYATTL